MALGLMRSCLDAPDTLISRWQKEERGIHSFLHTNTWGDRGKSSIALQIYCIWHNATHRLRICARYVYWRSSMWQAVGFNKHSSLLQCHHLDSPADPIGAASSHPVLSIARCVSPIGTPGPAVHSTYVCTWQSQLAQSTLCVDRCDMHAVGTETYTSHTTLLD